MPRTRWLIVALLTTVLFWLYIANLTFTHTGDDTIVREHEISSLRKRILQLEKQLNLENESFNRLREEVKHQAESQEVAMKIRAERLKKVSSNGHGAWKEPIPVLVFACNRKDAISHHIQQLIRYRPSAEKSPIVISQDCDDMPTADAIRAFGNQVIYIKHLSGDKANITVPKNHQRWITYYRIARHYKLALQHVFGKLGYTSVIITEDDLDIAPDFFDYFSATRYLLDEDKTLYCVSAWNDNGKPHLIDMKANEGLYRSDFFSGLGWMMSKELWDELQPIWPSGFWDDWIREPDIRKNRSCIRPEISRTAMTLHGKKGASEGLFFAKHLVKITLNKNAFEFTKTDLGYLKKLNYDTAFQKMVYGESKVVNIDDIFRIPKTGSVRVYYDGNIDYIKKADKLQIMHDFKAGVPRTAYLGVVTTYFDGLRVFLVPNTTLVHGYDKKWEVPAGMD